MIVIFNSHGGILRRALTGRDRGAFTSHYYNFNASGGVLRESRGKKSTESQGKTEPQRDQTFAKILSHL
jgi:hypothetical protein